MLKEWNRWTLLPEITWWVLGGEGLFVPWGDNSSLPQSTHATITTKFSSRETESISKHTALMWWNWWGSVELAIMHCRGFWWFTSNLLFEMLLTGIVLSGYWPRLSLVFAAIMKTYLLWEIIRAREREKNADGSMIPYWEKKLVRDSLKFTVFLWLQSFKVKWGLRNGLWDLILIEDKAQQPF